MGWTKRWRNEAYLGHLVRVLDQVVQDAGKADGCGVGAGADVGEAGPEHLFLELLWLAQHLGEEVVAFLLGPLLAARLGKSFLNVSRSEADQVTHAVTGEPIQCSG